MSVITIILGILSTVSSYVLYAEPLFTVAAILTSPTIVLILFITSLFMDIKIKKLKKQLRK